MPFYVPELEKVFVMEIDGALESVYYRGHSTGRTEVYLMNGFVEGKDLITVRFADSHDLNVSQIRSLIRAAIEAAIDDLIIEELEEPQNGTEPQRRTKSQRGTDTRKSNEQNSNNTP